MKKFIILLKKEIRELLTPQTLVPFLIVIVIFYFFGKFASKVSEQQKAPTTIAIIDKDGSALSKSLIDSLIQANLKPKVFLNGQNLPDIMRKENISFGAIIPSGFEKSIADLKPKKIDSYALMTNFSIAGSSKYATLDKVAALINEKVSNLYLTKRAPGVSPILLKNPIQASPHTIIKGNMAKVAPVEVLSFLSRQSYLIPVILFLVIVFASQMIATSVASEKENKTLETLLTAPINRKTLVVAKMVGAGIVALLLSAIYMVGFRSYLSGATASASGQSIDQGVLHNLGLVLTPGSYLLLGLIIFLGILVALAIAMILGAFSEDVKSVQAAITPLMVLILIPYFATMFLDINTLPTFARYVILAIPFSHIFMAMPNLYLHNNSTVVYGILYELIIFLIFVWIAAWIFSTDKILTMKWKFGKKK